MIQPKKSLGEKLSACDLHQAAPPLQLSRADPNHRSTAIKVILITIALTDLYLDHFLGGRKSSVGYALRLLSYSSKSEEMQTQNIFNFDLGFSTSSCDIVSGSCTCVCLSAC